MGDESGKVLMVNLVSGKILSQTPLHAKEISGMAFCGKNGYLLTTGAEGNISISHEVGHTTSFDYALPLALLD